MALLDSVGQKKDGGGSTAQLIHPESGMHICRISPESGESIIRIIPERHADGTIRPMLNGSVGGQHDWSNTFITSITTLAGERGDKLTIINEPSDNDGSGTEPTWPLSGLFIRLKGMQNKGKLPPHMKDRVDALLKGEGQRNFKAALPKSQEVVAVQAIVKVINGKVLDKATPKQVVLMSGPTAQSLGKVLTGALTAGMDLFGPNGYWIKFVPQAQTGNPMIKMAVAQLGDPCPASIDTLKPMWVPWADIWVRMPRREMLRRVIQAFDRDVVSLAFPSEVEELMAEKAMVTAARVAQAVPAVAPVQAPARAAAPVQAFVPAPTPPAPPAAPAPVMGLESMLSSTPVDLGGLDMAPPAAAPAAGGTPITLLSAEERLANYFKATGQTPPGV